MSALAIASSADLDTLSVLAGVVRDRPVDARPATVLALEATGEQKLLGDALADIIEGRWTIGTFCDPATLNACALGLLAKHS